MTVFVFVVCHILVEINWEFDVPHVDYTLTVAYIVFWTYYFTDVEFFVQVIEVVAFSRTKDHRNQAHEDKQSEHNATEMLHVVNDGFSMARSRMEQYSYSFSNLCYGQCG